MQNDVEKYRLLIEKLPDAFAYHSIVTGDDGTPVDYTFLVVNKAFEDMFGVKRDKLIGKNVTEVLPGIEKCQFDWINILGQVAINCESKCFESYFEPQGRWYNVCAYSDDPGFFAAIFHDKSEAKNNELALLESEEHFRDLVNHAGDLVQCVDSDGKFVFVNQAWLSNLGYSQEDLEKISLWDIIHPDSLEHCMSAFQEVLEGKTFGKVEAVFLSKNGPSIPVEGNVNVKFDDEGRFLQTRGIFRNITERKKVEEDLRQNEKRAKKQRVAITRLVLDENIISGEMPTLINKITAITSEAIDVERTSIWILDEKKEKLKCLSLYEATTGTYSRGSILKVKRMSRYFEALQQESRIYAANAQEDPRTMELTEDYLKPFNISSLLDAGIIIDGQLKGVVSFEHVGSPRTWQADEEAFASTVAAMVSQLFVTAERNKLVKSLQQSEEKYRLLTENITDIVWAIDLKGNLTYMSPVIEKLTGFTSEEIMSMPMDEYFVREDYEAMIAKLTEELAKPPGERAHSTFMEARHKTKDNRQVTVELHASWILDEKGNYIGVQGSTRDISERKKAERALRDMEALENLLMIMALELVNIPLENVDEAINRMLEKLGLFSRLDRVYIFHHDYEHRITTNTHEWCAEGIRPEIDNLQAIPFDQMTGILELHKKGDVFIVPLVSDMPENDSIRKIIEPQGIVSLLLMPMMYQGANIGFVGFDAVRKKKEFSEVEITMLSVFAELIVNIEERRKKEQTLRDNELRYREILETIEEGFYESDLEGTIIACNRAATNLLGYGEKEIIGMSYKALFKNPDAIFNAFNEVFRSGKPNYSVVMEMIRKDGLTATADFSITLAYDKQGNISGFRGMGRDITERKKAEEALAYRLAYEKLVSDISTFFVNLPAEQFDDRINFALEAVGSFFKVDRSYVYRFSQDYSTYSNTHLWSIPGIEGYFDKDQNFPAELTPWWVNELRNGRIVNIADVEKMPPEAAKDQQDFLAEDIKSLLTLPLSWQGEVFGCFGFDLVNEKRTWPIEEVALLQVIAELITGAIVQHDADQRIRHLSLHDQLTNLYNRHFLEEEMQRLDTKRQLPISIIMADLNGLKLINDTYGHSTGDEMLQRTAEVLKKVCRKEDIIARFGGDEFIIYLPLTTEKDALAIGKRISQAFLDEQINDVPITISIGIAVKNNIAQDIKAVLREAENKMYQNKLTESSSGKSAVLNALLKTLAEKSYETENHTRNMQEVALKIGEKLGLPETELTRLNLMIILHDIGKINIPEELLVKKENLSQAEWEIMKKHSETGYRICRATEEFAHVAEDILAHHEKWDGTGYPQGLKGDNIPILARITALADAYEVMSNGRPYKEAMPPDAIKTEIKSCAGTHFDPQLAEILLSIISTDDPK